MDIDAHSIHDISLNNFIPGVEHGVCNVSVSCEAWNVSGAAAVAGAVEDGLLNCDGGAAGERHEDQAQHRHVEQLAPGVRVRATGRFRHFDTGAKLATRIGPPSTSLSNWIAAFSPAFSHENKHSCLIATVQSKILV